MVVLGVAMITASGSDSGVNFGMGTGSAASPATAAGVMTSAPSLFKFWSVNSVKDAFDPLLCHTSLTWYHSG